MRKSWSPTKALLVAFAITVCIAGACCCCRTSAVRLRPTVLAIVQPGEPWPLDRDPVWHADLDNVIVAVPVVTEDRVYVATLGGLVSLDRTTGEPVWESHFDNTGTSANTAAGGGFVATGSPSALIVLDSATGEVVWDYHRMFLTTIIIDEDRLYAGFDFSEVCAFDLSTGDLLWQSREPGRAHYVTRLALSGNHLIVLQSGWRIYALDTDSGQIEWDRPFEEGLREDASVFGEHVIGVASVAYSIRASDGQLEWEVPSPGRMLQTGVTVSDGRVFWATDSTLWAVDAEDGRAVWSVDTGAEIICSPLASDGQTLWVRISYPYSALLAYDARSGQMLAEERFRAPFYEFGGIGPVVSDGELYLVSGNRVVMYPESCP